jgi:F-type H+-transporting ATPase subunit a|tara:strand:- start:467 stop:649 length:183 start_codon:yes stop_codon:yes gene_type:complete
MMGDHIVLSQFSNLAPWFVPIVFMILGILVSLIQAYVFTVLTMVYIQMAVAHHDHDEDHH